MIESSYYTADFYSHAEVGSYTSAQSVLPLVKQFIQPRSVIDIGCGVGYWLKVWKDELEVNDVLGIEGPYVTEEMLKIGKEYILFSDLKTPLPVDRRYDLVMSLEVAEHLPESYSKNFVKELTALSDVVLFSAAIEGQGGTYHINEQMPEYWSKIFNEIGFVAVDCIRPEIWGNQQVEWFYKQNILLYIKKERLKDFPLLTESYKNTDAQFLIRIHPVLYRKHMQAIKRTSTLLGFLRWKLYPIKRRLKRIIKK